MYGSGKAYVQHVVGTSGEAFHLTLLGDEKIHIWESKCDWSY